MDILTHTLSGMVVGVTVAALMKGPARAKVSVVVAGVVGGFLPDIDAVSLWSKFDTTFGKFFDLTVLGKNIYSGKYWYSHHGFMHSLLAGGIFASVIALFLLLGRRFLNFVNGTFLMVGVFFCGYIVHLLEDIVTPGSTWGGVRLFFPSEKYVGGFGNVWWWNNYDIFIIVLSVLVINMCLLMAGRFVINKLVQVLPVFIFILGSIFIIIQINSRTFDFSYSGYTAKYGEYEKKSQDIQKEILGVKLYSLMKKFDDRLKFYF